MSRSIKALLILLLLLSGCTKIKDDPKDEKIVFPDPIGNTVAAPIKIPYVTVNPITINTISVEENTIVYASRITIAGLKDQAVQTKINDAIKARFDILMSYKDLTKLPPFRGIKQKVKTGATLANFNVYASAAYNANNVLSIVFNAYVGITNPDQNQVYVNITDAMTFELIHGTQLTLSDFFTNEADVGKLVNDAFNTKLASLNSQDETQDNYYWYAHLMQVAAFTGIKADQPFFIQDDGLSLIIDYRTPQFETNLNSYPVTLPYHDFGTFIAITQRFATEDDLYINPIVDRQFLILGDPQMTNQVEQLSADPNQQIRLSYPNDVDTDFIALLTSMKLSLKDQLNDFLKDHPVQFVSAAVSARETGPYVCLFANGEAYGDVESKYINWSDCYDKNHHKMAIADYFKPGFDYEKALKGVIQNEIDVGYLPKDISIDDVYASLTVQVMINGFYLAGKAYSASLGQDQYFGSNPLFSIFGLENLTVFDD